MPRIGCAGPPDPGAGSLEAGVIASLNSRTRVQNYRGLLAVCLKLTFHYNPRARSLGPSAAGGPFSHCLLHSLLRGRTCRVHSSARLAARAAGGARGRGGDGPRGAAPCRRAARLQRTRRLPAARTPASAALPPAHRECGLCFCLLSSTSSSLTSSTVESRLDSAERILNLRSLNFRGLISD